MLNKESRLTKCSISLREKTGKIRITVKRTLITHAPHCDVPTILPCCILLSFIAQGVEFSSEDQSGWQGVQGLSQKEAEMRVKVSASKIHAVSNLNCRSYSTSSALRFSSRSFSAMRSRW